MKHQRIPSGLFPFCIKIWNLLQWLKAPPWFSSFASRRSFDRTGSHNTLDFRRAPKSKLGWEGKGLAMPRHSLPHSAGCVDKASRHLSMQVIIDYDYLLKLCVCVCVLILSSTKWLHHLDWPTECACHRGSQVECLTISQRSPPTLICSSIHCTWSGWESSLRSHHEARWFGVLAGPWDWASAKPHAGLPNLEKPLKTKLYSLQMSRCSSDEQSLEMYS